MPQDNRLVFACNFESFLATKYGVTKRFGLEGLESVIPGFKALIDTAAELGSVAVCAAVCVAVCVAVCLSSGLLQCVLQRVLQCAV